MSSIKCTFNETHEKKLGKSENDKKYCKKKNFVQVDSVLPYGFASLPSAWTSRRISNHRFLCLYGFHPDSSVASGKEF